MMDEKTTQNKEGKYVNDGKDFKRNKKSNNQRRNGSNDNRFTEARGAGADNTGKYRNNYDHDRNRNKKGMYMNKKRHGRSNGVETIADIKADIARVEKEISLEIREIREMV